MEENSNSTQDKEKQADPSSVPEALPEGENPIPKSDSVEPVGDPIPKEEAEPSGLQPVQSLQSILLEKELISRDQLDVALKQQAESGGTADLGQILISLGFITETVLGELLNESAGIKHFDFTSATLDVNLIKQVPKHVAKQFKIVPISLYNDELKVATSDVYNIIAFDQIKTLFGKNIKVTPLYANQAHIDEVIEKYYEYEMRLESIFHEIENLKQEQKEFVTQEEGFINPTVRLVDALLLDAVKKEASDLHFEPEDNFVRLRYRIDGQLRQILTFHKEYWPSIVVRIKIIAGMNIAETREPQDGRISFEIMGRKVDFRLSSQPTVHGENIVARILDRSKALIDLTELNFSEKNFQHLQKLLKKPEGVFIITGPTGSGKTTTLYSILNHINTVSRNIMTLEDPVEYSLSLIRQTNVKENTNLDFVHGIRSILRQDPDVILVGEVRDTETAQMMIRAAMTGHQVFTTLHTNDAFGAIPRLIDLGVSRQLLSGNIVAIIAQRLARKLCEVCKEEYSPTQEEIDFLQRENIKSLFRARGCESCSKTGYRGRIALHELVGIDKTLDHMILTDTSRKNIVDYVKEMGFSVLLDDGIDKILMGLTDIQELINTTDATERLLQTNFNFRDKKLQ